MKRYLVIVGVVLFAAFPVSASMTIYYSDPTVASPSTSRQLDYQVKSFVKAAKTSLDIAVYNLTHPGITDGLIAAHKRGVKVRVVCESANWNDYFAKLQGAGITVVKDDNPVHMHNKFIVRDGNAVLTGSYNFTPSGTKSDKNTLVVMKTATAVAKIYTTEFEKMFVKKLFGKNKTKQTVITAMQDSYAVRIYFSPAYGEITAKIVAELKKAKKTIYVSAFVITDKEISDALIAAKKRGVKVYIALDERQSNTQTWSRHKDLIAGGCLVRFSSIGGLIHDKNIVIDGGTTGTVPVGIMGSFNFTNQANDQNDENILFISQASKVSSLKSATYAAYSKMAK